jgi:hypothetical protein
VARDEARLMALRMVPMMFKQPHFALERMQKRDAAKYAVVCLPTDRFSDVVEKTRRYPGWVIVFVVHAPPSGNGEARIDIREFLPRQPQPGDVEPDMNLTIGEAMEMFARADAAGIDLLQRNPEFAGSFKRQRSVPVG